MIVAASNPGRDASPRRPRETRVLSGIARGCLGELGEASLPSDT